MAITRLTDIITVFDSKWIYGDTKFGYDGEVNQDHDTKYPLMLINPPDSIMPVIYDGREEYSFEINFYNLYSQSAQSVVTLQKRWDNLQDLANEWLDMVLKNYQDVTVEVYLNDESIEIERVKEVANDKLVQIKLTFTMSGFTKCFRPVSNYPSDYSELKLWYSADSKVTFDIPSKKVSLWDNRDSFPRNLVQATSANQPLWYGYDGGGDKAYVDFNTPTSGDLKLMTSNANLPITGEDFTMFIVAQMSQKVPIGTNQATLFYYTNNSNNEKIKIGYRNSNTGADTNKYFFTLISSVAPSGQSINLISSGAVAPSVGKDAIICVRVKKVSDTQSSAYLSIHETGLDIEYNLENQTFRQTNNYDDAKFTLGNELSPSAAKAANAQIQEYIAYNNFLETTQKDDIVGYLRTKYNI